jgi:hypothetical protein
VISRQQIINRLRQADYTYVNRAKRTELYRQKGGTQRVPVPLCDFFTEQEAAWILAQAGLTRQQVETFIAGCVKS